jgi:hypothetical protein
MEDEHRVRLGLNEWRRLPKGYRQLEPGERVQALDVQRLNADWFAEYPARGMLVGTLPCGDWYRKEDLDVVG